VFSIDCRRRTVYSQSHHFELLYCSDCGDMGCDVSEEHACSIFSVKVEGSMLFRN
jgi:Zn finger protein HypA/HybF involved in hydrogenase expression